MITDLSLESIAYSGSIFWNHYKTYVKSGQYCLEKRGIFASSDGLPQDSNLAGTSNPNSYDGLKFIIGLGVNLGFLIPGSNRRWMGLGIFFRWRRTRRLCR
jgi:hypothetical protein